MKNIANMDSLACSQSCYEIFRECLEKGEDVSVCRMKRVPCDCGCSDGEMAYAAYIRQKML